MAQMYSEGTHFKYYKRKGEKSGKKKLQSTEWYQSTRTSKTSSDLQNKRD